ARRRQAAVAGEGMDRQLTGAAVGGRDAAIDAEIDPAIDAEIHALLDAIYQIYHHDFRGYVRSSLRRRSAAAQVQLRCATIAELHDRAVREPAVFGQLLRFLTVQVTDMFRDPAYFRAIRTHVVPYLQTYAALKVWVAGCATGEEAYSLAIVLA